MRKPASKKPRKKLDLEPVLERILYLMMERRPEDISFTLVSKACNVPRPTLYYYFGNSQHTIINEAVRHGIRVFLSYYTLDIAEATLAPDWRSFQHARMEHSIRLMTENPRAATLYFMYRNAGGAFEKSVSEFEDKYCERLAQVWKHYHGELPSRHAVRFSGHMKLGLFFGFSTDRGFWEGAESRRALDTYLPQFTDLISQVLGKKPG